jgi:hypothetical protein
MNRLVTFTSLICCCINCYAQDLSALRYFKIGLGINHISLQDQVFSPLVYRGAGALFDFSFYNHKTKRTHHLNTRVSFQELTPKLNQQGSGRVENTNIYLNYEYLRSFSTNRNHHIGIGLYNFVSYRTFNFLVEDDISLDLFSSLNLVYAYSLSVKEQHNIRVSASLPFIAYVVGRMRVPNDFSEEVFQSIIEDPNNTPTGEILSSGDFLAVNKFFDVRLTLDYQYDLSNKIRLGFTYFFQHYTYPKFETVKYGSSQYSGSIIYKL